MIFGPDGKALCEPIGVGEEAIMKADIDLRDIDYAKTVRGWIQNGNLEMVLNDHCDQVC
jgi:hypothetical protein